MKPGQKLFAITEFALRQNNIEEIERVIQDAEEAGIDVREVVNVKFGKNQSSPLQISCSEGHFDLVCLLLQNGADINYTDILYGWTALHCAAQNHIEICEILIKYGADITLLTDRGTSAFHYIAKLFVDERHQAVQISVMDELLKKGQKVNAQTKSGETPLHHSCLEGNAFTTEYLLSHSADITIVNKYGENAFHYACRRGADQVVTLLLQHGADPDACGGLGTPLEIAEQNQQQHIIDLINQFLQEGGIDSDNEEEEPFTNISISEISEPDTSRHRRTRSTASVMLGRLQISPDSRKLNGVRSILLRNFIMEDTHLKNLYFTIHFDEQSDEILYKSRIVYHTRQPTWQLLEFEKDFSLLKRFFLQIWDDDTSTCIFSKSIKLYRYGFIGTNTSAIKPHMKNILVLELQDGYYTQEKIDPKSIPDLVIPVIRKESYSKAQLQTMINLSKDLKETKEEKKNLKEQLSNVLPKYIEEQQKKTKRDLLLQRIEILKKENQKKKEQIEKNKYQIEQNQKLMEFKLQNVSKALTSLIVDEQVFENDTKTYLKNKETYCELLERCNLRRGLFIRRLRTVYPITQSKNTQLPSCLCIGYAPLPNTSEQYSLYDEETISTSLGFVAHVLHLLSIWLDIPLRYPIELCGSRSHILDPISVDIINPKFPLYLGRGIDKTRFEYGLFLLNVNLQQLVHSQGYEVISLRQTLPNLQVLMIGLARETM